MKKVVAETNVAAFGERAFKFDGAQDEAYVA